MFRGTYTFSKTIDDGDSLNATTSDVQSMNSPAFKSRFSPEELTIIEDLANAWLLPQAQPPAAASPK